MKQSRNPLPFGIRVCPHHVQGREALKLIQATGEIAAAEAEQRHESRRERAAAVEEVLDRIVAGAR
jgi:hypothetical protein